MTHWHVIIATVLCVTGLFFATTGVIGMLRMPDVYTRIQCSSKTITMGALPTLAGVAVAQGFATAYAARALFVGALILVINPAASHALARAAYRQGVPMWDGAVADEALDGAER